MLAVDQIGPDEQLILQAMDSLIAERRVVSQQLLRQSVAEQLSTTYDIIVRRLIDKGLLEEVYAEGFDIGLRRIGS
jgi:hypothetical protein